MTAWPRRLPWFMAWFARQPAAPACTKPPAAARSAAPKGDSVADVTRLEERRAEALRRMFPKLYSWYASRSEWRIALEVQEYLAGASNIVDLENRIRAVEQRCHFRP